MRLLSPIPIALMVALVAGCGGEALPQDLSGRLEAAKGISDRSRRDPALVAVAQDAGKAGSGEITKNAVAAISDAGLRSSTAAEVAVALADAGNAADAVEVAKQIADTGLRNQTLERIAEKK